MTHTYIQIQYVIIYLQHSTGNGQADRFDMRFLSVEIFFLTHMNLKCSNSTEMTSQGAGFIPGCLKFNPTIQTGLIRKNSSLIWHFNLKPRF